MIDFSEIKYKYTRVCVCTVLTQTVICESISDVAAGRRVKTLASLCKIMTHEAKVGAKPPSTPA